MLLKVNLFGGGEGGIEELIRESLFLHLGTFLAALIYFRRDIIHILKRQQPKTFNFLLVATLIFGGLGYGLFKLLETAGSNFEFAGKVITLIVGLLLLFTAWLQIRIKSGGTRQPGDLNKLDNILLGLVQGVAVLPGLSRSGLTVSALLLRNVDEEQSLRLSFLLSLPIVLGGNIFLNLRGFVFESEMLWGLLASFVFGLLTIHLLLRLARRINFGWFVLFFAFLVIGSVWI